MFLISAILFGGFIGLICGSIRACGRSMRNVKLDKDIKSVKIKTIIGKKVTFEISYHNHKKRVESWKIGTWRYDKLVAMVDDIPLSA